MTLTEWAIKHHVSFAALTELQAMWGDCDTPPDIRAVLAGKTEDQIDGYFVMRCARRGVKVWRNNVGVLKREDGVPIRFGLANDSAARNKVLKSSDRIGINPVLITPAHVGTVIGQFFAREIKRADWRYSGTEREVAQLNFIKLVLANGGDAAFENGSGLA